MRSFRYTNSKGATISLGANSIPSTLENGVVGCWPMENIQEYPTGAATYIQTEWATADGWTARQGTLSLSVSGGKLVVNQTIAGTSFAVRSGTIGSISGLTVRVWADYDETMTFGQYYNGSAYVTNLPITRVGSRCFCDFVLTTTENFLTFGFVYSSSSTRTASIDIVYIGDGSYAANSLIDNSGNGNHGQIFGATLVDGVSGKALIGDGTNDYTVTPSVSSFGVGRTTSVSLWCNLAGTSGYVFSYPDAVNNNRFYLQVVGANQLRFIVNNSQTIHTATLPSGNNHIVAIRNQTTGRASMFVNGAQVADVAITTPPTADANTSFYLFANTNVSGFLNATIDEPRIYNRALSAAEVNALYRFRAAPFIATGETSYGIIESVEGIDSADADIQSTRAPLQDGQTYIDSLFDSREVVVRGSIMVPKNLDTIYARRKIILDALNPKYGNGSLDFFYGANTINHRVLQNVVVEKVQFPNKPFQNPFQEFQITFRANDPYFYEPLTDTHGIQILSGESRTFTVGGEQDTPVAIRIYGAATNPAATNSTVGETIALTYSLAGGSYIDIDTRFGSKTIKLNGATSLIGNLDIGSSFWNLRVGSNTVSYTGGGYVILLWRARYIGV